MFFNKIHKTEKPEALTYIGLAAMDVDGLVGGWKIRWRTGMVDSAYNRFYSP